MVFFQVSMGLHASFDRRDFRIFSAEGSRGTVFALGQALSDIGGRPAGRFS